MSRHDLLGDLYGSSRAPLLLRVRRNAFGTSASPATFPIPTATYPELSGAHVERPLLLAGRFLRLPIVNASHAINLSIGLDNESPDDNPATPVNELLPRENDVWVGRVVTFLDGPLTLKSARVVRYIGDTRNSNPSAATQQCFSILVDLGDLADELLTHNATTKSLSEWANFPSSTPGLQGLSFCYGNPAGSPFGVGSRLLLNDAPYNSFGWGIQENGGTEMSSTTSAPMAFQPNFVGVPAVSGDADEDWDAADYANMALSYTHQPVSGSVLTSDDIIPSFHRAALVNYLANWKDPTQFTEAELIQTMNAISAAVLRPLSYRVITSNATLVSNFNFTGGNRSSALADRTPQLDIVYDNNWASNGAVEFIRWVQWLTRGEWDVDNNADGVMDSIWIDPNLPIITSREGKLLKALVSYYIEDMDGKLDINAVGNLNQTLAAGQPYSAPTSNWFQVAGTTLSQGFGYGPAEISMQAAFANPAEYRQFLLNRYGVDGYPGEGLRTAGSPPNAIQYARSELAERERNTVFRHGFLPGLPMAVRGMLALGFDHFGNPLLNNSYQPTAGALFDPVYDQATKDPYEARWRDGARGDSPFTLSDWEKLYRRADWDRSAMSNDLAISPSTGNWFSPNSRLSGLGTQVVAPRTSHLRHPALAHPNSNNAIGSSLRDLVQSIAARRMLIPTSGANNNAFVAGNYNLAFNELFPLEFHRAQPMDLNRPFGNGKDNDGDGQIDDPDEISRLNAESARRIQVPADGSGPPVEQNSAIAADYTWGIPGIDPQLSLEPAGIQAAYGGAASRQLYARHLYCLAMLILPEKLYPSGRPGPVEGLDRARLLAQWAVNAVDFRDADHVNTRFPYDPDPFNRGNPSEDFWNPRLATGTSAATVVWGMEQPELLLTESLATHDVRAKDLEADGGTLQANQDNGMDLDQYRTPEASLFLELFNPRTTGLTSDPRVPGVGGSLYAATAAGVGALNVSALSGVNPFTDVPNLPSPVWRIAISKPHGKATEVMETPLARVTDVANRHNFTYQLSSNYLQNGLAWNQATPLAPAPDAMEIDRVILFATGANAAQRRNIADTMADLQVPAIERRGRVFFNIGTNLLVQGGQYLVVGPRGITYFGSKQEPSPIPTADLHERRPNNHRIVLGDGGGQPNTPPIVNSNWATVYLHDGTRVPQYQLRDCVTMVAGIQDNDTTAGGIDTTVYPEGFVGVNVSAPHVDQYYPEPTSVINSDNTDADPVNGALGYADFVIDGYDDFNSPVGTSPGSPFDSGDVNRYPLGVDPTDPDDPNLRNWQAGLDTDLGIPVPGTQLNWCTAFLQRLADPERPFHAIYNPYITVDWHSIDLTVFSGEEDSGVMPSSYMFGTRTKNGAPASSAGFNIAQRGRTFLSYASDEPTKFTPAGSISGTNFTEVLATEPPTPATGTANTMNHMTLGYTNSSYTYDRMNGSALPGPFVCAPQGISSVFWANRPFVNAYEAALVPSSSIGQLMQEFSIPTTASTVYRDPITPHHFGHLLNFFQEMADPTSVAVPEARRAMSPATLFELMSTPSPWLDTDDYIPPAAVDVASNASLPQVMRDAISQQFFSLRAPYNFVSNFTEPGRINLNTVNQELAYNALMANTNGQLALDFVQFQNSRRGYPVAPATPHPSFLSSPNPRLSQNYPTQFAGVFKSTFGAGAVPQTREPVESGDPLAPRYTGVGVLDTDARINPVQSTIMRSAPEQVTGAARGFPGSSVTFFKPSDSVTLFQPPPQAIKRAFTDYLPFSRLENLTTTRSNVFAVRVTIGFFEFNPSAGLGREYGEDQGTVMRHRGFYLIDRSIPVGYQEGQDLNTDDCIILRRIIE
ncbi:MAG: hypothetical protein KDB22_19615 [Planctomycetales bacterium]|nr:hypothetical protein [Planctomycetales bacterium]